MVRTTGGTRGDEADPPPGLLARLTGNGKVRLALSAVSLVLAGLLIFWMPLLVGVDWGQILTQFTNLSLPWIAAMFLLWAASLWAYTYVLTASLPGLTNWQGFLLNASGSAVSNLLPFGGAAGMAVTLTMTGKWGLRRADVMASILVSGVWNTLFRFLLPAIGILALLTTGTPLSRTFSGAATAAGITLVAVVVALSLALYKEGVAHWLGRVLDRALQILPARLRPHQGVVEEALVRLRHSTIAVVRTAWARLSFWMVAFLGFQCVLFFACLHATGSYPGLGEAIAVFALGRVLTTAVVTPSGVGISEGATLWVLVNQFHTPQTPATAAILLFSFFSYAIEIPVGGLALAGWTVSRRR